MVETTVSSNSANTSKGRSTEPSEEGAATSPSVAAGSVPLPVMEDSARARPPASSRYFVTNSSQSSVRSGMARSLPNETVNEAGPTSRRASPENSGPQTRTCAPMEMPKRMVPSHVLILTPAEMRA